MLRNPARTCANYALVLAFCVVGPELSAADPNGPIAPGAGEELPRCALPAAALDLPLLALADPQSNSDTRPAAAAGADRYGPLGLFDHRSVYGRDWFPEPLLADEADVENEVSARYQHAEARGHQFDAVHAEAEHSLGLVTLEVGGGYESDRTATADPVTGATERDTEEGFTNVELGARVPFYQYVSPDNFFDDTLVLGLELAPPTQTKISKDTEVVPKVFNLLRLGESFSLQTGVGVATLIGPLDHGLSTMEYDVVAGYELPHDTLPLPGVLSTTPLVELDGTYQFNQDASGQNQLFAVVGLHCNFDSWPGFPAQPRLGIGYMIPLDPGARSQFDWGVVVSLIFEY
jgi:hypothetical protein